MVNKAEVNKAAYFKFCVKIVWVTSLVGYYFPGLSVQALVLESFVNTGVLFKQN